MRLLSGSCGGALDVEHPFYAAQQFDDLLEVFHISDFHGSTSRDGDVSYRDLFAAGAMAATLETSARGIVYDHRASTRPAERLLAELQTLLAEITKEGGTALERDSAIALRRMEAAAREIAKTDAGGASFQLLLVRILFPPGGPEAGERPDAPTAPRLVPHHALSPEP